MTTTSTEQRLKRDFKSQIEFLRKEREIALETANLFVKDSLPYKQLLLKAHTYSEIEQNMYALCAITPQMLK